MSPDTHSHTLNFIVLHSKACIRPSQMSYLIQCDMHVTLLISPHSQFASVKKNSGYAPTNKMRYELAITINKLLYGGTEASNSASHTVFLTLKLYTNRRVKSLQRHIDSSKWLYSL